MTTKLGRPSKGLGKPFQCALYENEDKQLIQELESKGVPKAETVRKWCKERFQYLKENKALRKRLKA